ncbi:MAG: ATP phosphoribosyltransferase regulatory subunit [Synergistaceae bacterium]|nr:ATP phosphoribosyltransferase regulatory subunit [Synergistaceae bacterium]
MYIPVLTSEENSALALRELYSSCGFKFFRMTRFEEYDFYAGKKDFLASQSILTFTDINGRLMALRPDVTLSVIKHAPPGKYYYDEKVYRVPKDASSFREIAQCGVEHTGVLSGDDVREVLSLALRSLRAVSGGRNVALDVADAGEAARLIPQERRNEMLACIAARNIHGLRELGASDELVSLAEEGRGLPFGLDDPEIRYDISAVTSLAYYSGVVFKGYIEGVPDAVLSGGQYDIAGASGTGFAVYLDALEGLRND